MIRTKSLTIGIVLVIMVYFGKIEQNMPRLSSAGKNPAFACLLGEMPSVFCTISIFRTLVLTFPLEDPFSRPDVH
jgi:hypothetical protein